VFCYVFCFLLSKTYLIVCFNLIGVLFAFRFLPEELELFCFPNLNRKRVYQIFHFSKRRREEEDKSNLVGFLFGFSFSLKRIFKAENKKQESRRREETEEEFCDTMKKRRIVSPWFIDTTRTL